MDFNQDQNQDYKRVHKKFEEKPKTQFVTDNRFNVNNEKKDPNKITITTKTKSFKLVCFLKYKIICTIVFYFNNLIKHIYYNIFCTRIIV